MDGLPTHGELVERMDVLVKAWTDERRHPITFDYDRDISVCMYNIDYAVRLSILNPAEAYKFMRMAKLIAEILFAMGYEAGTEHRDVDKVWEE